LHPIPTVRIAVLTSIALLVAAPCLAQSAKWDQARVTALAVELSEVAVELQSSFRREPPQAIGTGQARARASFQDSLRVLRTETRALASELEAGAGFEETLPIARRARTTIRDLREEGRRMSWKEPVVGHAQRAEALIAQLAPFYFDAGDAGAGAGEGGAAAGAKGAD
jgi:hypothetical protein